MRRAAGAGLFAVRTEGGLLSPDILASLADPGAKLEGVSSEDYHLGAQRLGAAITRSWNRMLGEWARFQESVARTPPGDPATGATRDRLLYPLFQELGYGRLVSARGMEVDGKSYAVSHLWNRTPIHLVGHGVDLDKRSSGVAGAAQASPHGLVQELLNRSPDHLWGMVSNGLRLRILRDNRSLTRQAYVELDLEAIFGGELYPDFVVLWMLCHQSRVEAERPEQCWLERWSTLGREQGARALDTLRQGVTTAIESLGRGFLSHRANTALRDRLRTGELQTQEYYRQLLRLVYRLLFLFVAEDRDALHPRDTSAEARAAYREYYSTHRLRSMAGEIRGTAHADLYAAFKKVMQLLGTLGAPEIGLPALGSYLWSDQAVADLRKGEIANSDLLSAVKALAFTERERTLWPVDYRNLGSEELGSVYESLLELHPRIDAGVGSFDLDVAAGHERKTTGSYYTPHSLVQCLLDSALDPVLDEAAKSAKPEQAILDLKVCDPASGSGHFLIAAAHRMARRLASARTGDEEPSPEATRAALRDVIGHCLYGVDVNPMAVELCKVSLWMEALEPGKPLSFLDAHIQCGNSLLGTTPELMAKGIPDEAIGELTGDDKATIKAHRKRNKEERQGQLGLKDEAGGFWGEVLPDVQALRAEGVDDSPLAGVLALEDQSHRHVASEAFRHARTVADAWCAAFVWPRSKGQKLPGLTHGLWRDMVTRPETVPAPVVAEVERIAASYRFFHWYLAFPEVFGRGGGGFDVVLGNPPWERIKLQEAEWFAERRPEIAIASVASERKRMISALIKDDAPLHQEFLEARRLAEGESAIVRGSGRFPFCGRGDINTYSVFAEAGRDLMSATGRLGIIVPAGIATDDTTKHFFGDLVEHRSLVALYSFENEERLFAQVHHAYKFCLLSLRSGRGNEPALFAFYLRRPSQIADPDRSFALSAEDIELINPNTRTCAVFRSRRDAEITRGVYRRVPILIKPGTAEGNPWGMSFLAMFHMSNDSTHFSERGNLHAAGYRLDGSTFRRGADAYLPLYEAKMIHQFDHRFGTYEGQSEAEANTGVLPYFDSNQHSDPGLSPLPRYWVHKGLVAERLEGRWDREWLVGWRDITNTTNERTVIASLIPHVGAGNSLPLMLLRPDAPYCAALVANLSAMVLDYIARQKVGGTHLNFFVYQQLPVLPPRTYAAPCPWSPEETLKDWILPRVLELGYTAHDMVSFARDCGYEGSPFRWDEERRFRLRCELDAAFFHLYGIGREDMEYILETFPIVKRHDEERWGEYRTKRVVAEVYRSMEAL